MWVKIYGFPLRSGMRGKDVYSQLLFNIVLEVLDTQLDRKKE